MTKRSQRYRSTSLPFEYRDSGIDFDLEAYSIDKGDANELELKPGQREVDLAPVLESEEKGDDWDQITLYGRLTVTEETVNAVFPSSEREDPPAKLYVAVRCHETIYRDSVLVSDPPTGPDTYEVPIHLYKEYVKGTVEIRPYAVRTEDQAADDKFAANANFRVASGENYSIVVDRPPGEGSSAIDGEEASFTREPHLPEGDKLYYLDFRNESNPKLWINSDHPRITDVLQSRGSVGAEPRMRDVILDQISYGVWTQLLLRAGSAVDEEGEVEHEWQETVLKTFVRNLYDVDNLSDAALRLKADLDDPQTLPHLMGRIDRELQEYIDPRTQLINLMEEGLSI